jgi:hypothetical protein
MIADFRLPIAGYQALVACHCKEIHREAAQNYISPHQCRLKLCLRLV